MIDSYPIGTTALIMAFIAIVIFAVYLTSQILTHTKVIRLSAAESVLISMFTFMLGLFLGLIIGQQVLLSVIVFFIFLFFSVLLFTKKANRWYLERQVRRGVSEGIQKEKHDTGGMN
jgi:hypothetical protein